MAMHTPRRNASADKWRHQAHRLIQAGRLREAQAKLTKLIRAVPDDVPACLALSDILYEQGRLRESSAPLLRACRHLPRNAPLLLDLINHLMDRGEVVAARQCMEALEQAPSPPPEWRMTQAHLRFALGEIATAKTRVETALAAGADRPADHHMHGLLQQFTGDIAGACATLERCGERWPTFGKAVLPLVAMHAPAALPADLARIEAQLDALPDDRDDPEGTLNRAHFELARFTALDRLGRYAEAWPALARCNALMHALNPYDAAAEEAVVEALIAATSGPPAAPADAAVDDGPIPIFIVGFTRSGTSLLDRLLSNHSQVASAGELVEFWRQLHWVANEPVAGSHSLRNIIRRSDTLDVARLGARYLEQTRWLARGQRYYIDKMPANVMMVDFIRRALPQARILLMVRDAMDVCYSNFKMFFGADTAACSYDLKALAHSHAVHTRLWDHWRAQRPGAMHEVRYGDLVRDTEPTLRGILDHLGLPFEAACLHPESNTSPISTPSSAQLQEPIHTRSIGEWKHYAEPLEPLRQALDSNG